MTTIFLWPAIATLVLVSMELVWMKRKNSPRYFITFFSILLAISSFFFIAKAEAADLKKIPNHKFWALADSEYIKYNNAYHSHVEGGHYFFEEANKLTWFISNRTDRKYAEELFRLGVLTAVSLGDWKIIVGNIIVSLAERGMDAYSVYNDMNLLLNESLYHFEMALFYLDILMRDGRGPSYGK